MKLLFLLSASVLLGIGAQNYLLSETATYDAVAYARGDAIEKDHIQIVYLPNNTCQIEASVDDISVNYRDYVRACMNNRQLRIQMLDVSPN
jgi:hypothetical protein